MIAFRHIRKVVDDIARQFSPQQIILFGSYANGTPTADSDVDILVVMQYRGREIAKSVEILNRTSPLFPIDLLVRRPAEAARSYAEFDPIMREVFDNGKILYEQHGQSVARQGRR
ncbi:MAG TPA: nucleotidyltransferase domain-containing protein [Tepidisphaeraceae bacterium]|jgi:predicted nucleotidyltransferase|nr:nucleotidyltransferase domain-containing protein [Tepidisphaeraceae bacterium]